MTCWVRVCRFINCHKRTSMKTFACMKACRRGVPCSNETEKRVWYVMINWVLVMINVNLSKIHNSECLGRGRNHYLRLELAGDCFKYVFVSPSPAVDEKINWLGKDFHEFNKPCRSAILEKWLKITENLYFFWKLFYFGYNLEGG